MDDSTASAETPRTIAPVVRKFKLSEQPSDFAYWQTQSYEARLTALEEIRQEYYGYTDEDEQRVERVLTVVKRPLCQPHSF